jgi:hypothetical protein
MTKESQALSKTIKKFDLVAADIACSAGTNKEQLSRLRNGHKDVYSHLMFRIIKALPLESRIFFLITMGVFDSDNCPTDLETISRSFKYAWTVAETDREFLQN